MAVANDMKVPFHEYGICVRTTGNRQCHGLTRAIEANAQNDPRQQSNAVDGRAGSKTGACWGFRKSHLRECGQFFHPAEQVMGNPAPSEANAWSEVRPF